MSQEQLTSTQCTSDHPARNEDSTGKCQRKVDFSIDAILGFSNSPPPDDQRTQHLNQPLPHYTWLDCTRYRPPKLPRCRKELQRCKYRNPRVPFAKAEVEFLEQQFQRNLYLSSHRTAKLAESLSMSPQRVKIWFQNRRARLRKEQELMPGQTKTAMPCFDHKRGYHQENKDTVANSA